MRERWPTHHPGRFEGCTPFGRYLHESYLHWAGMVDDEAVNEVWGDGMVRIGRRIIGWSANGFHWYERHATEAMADDWFVKNRDHYEGTADDHVPEPDESARFYHEVAP